MCFQTAHAQRNPWEYSEYPCEYTAFNAFPDRACTAEPCEYSEYPYEYSAYPCEYTAFDAFPDRACTAEPV